MIRKGKNIECLYNVLVFLWIMDEPLTSRPEMGAPLGPGWAEQAAFSGQIWLHHYWERETTRLGQTYCFKNNHSLL